MGTGGSIQDDDDEVEKEEDGYEDHDFEDEDDDDDDDDDEEQRYALAATSHYEDTYEEEEEHEDSPPPQYHQQGGLGIAGGGLAGGGGEQPTSSSAIAGVAAGGGGVVVVAVDKLPSSSSSCQRPRQVSAASSYGRLAILAAEGEGGREGLDGEEEEYEMSLYRLKQKLRESLRASGAVDAVVARLRSQLVAQLSLQHGLRGEDGCVVGRKQPSFEDMLLNSLIVEHLKHKGLLQTVSVFLPESQMANKVFSRADLAKALQLVEGTALHKRLIGSSIEEEGSSSNNNKKHRKEQGGSILHKILGEFWVHYRGASSVTMGTQTESSDILGHRQALDVQLRQIQSQYLESAEAARNNLEATQKTVEERMLAFQRECEERARKEVVKEIERLREVELSQIRCEESARHRRELEAMREELRGEYQQKLEKINTRAEDEEKRMATKLQAAEAAQYEARQKLLRELDLVKQKDEDGGRLQESQHHSLRTQELRQRDEDGVRLQESQQRGLRTEELRVKELRAEVEARLREVQRQESQLAVRIQGEVERARAEGARAYASQIENLKLEREFLTEETDKVRLERQACQQQIAELSALRTEVQDLRAGAGTLIDLRQRMAAYEAKYGQLSGYPPPSSRGGTFQMVATSSSIPFYPIPPSIDRSGMSKAALLHEVNALERARNEALNEANILQTRIQSLEFEMTELREMMRREKEANLDEIDRLKGREKEAWIREAGAEDLVRQLRSDLSVMEIENDQLKRKQEEEHADYEALQTETKELRRLLTESRQALDILQSTSSSTRPRSAGSTRTSAAGGSGKTSTAGLLAAFSRANREAAEIWAAREGGYGAEPPVPWGGAASYQAWLEKEGGGGELIGYRGPTSFNSTNHSNAGRNNSTSGEARLQAMTQEFQDEISKLKEMRQAFFTTSTCTAPSAVAPPVSQSSSSAAAEVATVSANARFDPPIANARFDPPIASTTITTTTKRYDEWHVPVKSREEEAQEVVEQKARAAAIEKANQEEARQTLRRAEEGERRRKQEMEEEAEKLRQEAERLADLERQRREREQQAEEEERENQRRQQAEEERRLRREKEGKDQQEQENAELLHAAMIQRREEEALARLREEEENRRRQEVEAEENRLRAQAEEAERRIKEEEMERRRRRQAQEKREAEEAAALAEQERKEREEEEERRRAIRIAEAEERAVRKAQAEALARQQLEREEEEKAQQVEKEAAEANDDEGEEEAELDGYQEFEEVEDEEAKIARIKEEEDRAVIESYRNKILQEREKKKRREEEERAGAEARAAAQAARIRSQSHQPLWGGDGGEESDGMDTPSRSKITQQQPSPYQPEESEEEEEVDEEEEDYDVEDFEESSDVQVEIAQVQTSGDDEDWF